MQKVRQILTEKRRRYLLNVEVCQTGGLLMEQAPFFRKVLVARTLAKSQTMNKSG